MIEYLQPVTVLFWKLPLGLELLWITFALVFIFSIVVPLYHWRDE